MSRPAQTSPSVRALHGGLVILVLVGYVAALGATASGEGLKLLPRLTLEHAPSPLAPPQLVGDAGGDGRVLTTLRPQTDRYGGHVHSHDAEVAPEARPRGERFPERRTVQVQGNGPAAEGLHAHDGVPHRHDAPPLEPSVILTVSLDPRRPPTAPAVTAPQASRAVDPGEPGRALHFVDLSVETPPSGGRRTWTPGRLAA